MKICPSCSKNVSGSTCLICGYNLSTGKPGIDSSTISGHTIKKRLVAIWIGYFENRDTLDSYFEEIFPREDDQPMSMFAEEQGFNFYDHDYFGVEFIEGPRSFENILSEFIIVDGKSENIVNAFKQVSIPKCNFVAVLYDEVPTNSCPKVVKGRGYEVYSLGSFEYSGVPS